MTHPQPQWPDDSNPARNFPPPAASTSPSPQQATPPPKKKSSKKLGCLILVIFAVLLVIIIGVANSGDNTSSSPSPTSTVPATPQGAMEAAITSALGSSDRNVPRVTKVVYDDTQHVEVDWAINDNLTHSLIVNGARLDALNIIKAIKRTGLPVSSLEMNGTFPMRDQYGNGAEVKVVGAAYSSDTLAKINTDGIDPSHIFDVADNANLNPNFQ